MCERQKDAVVFFYVPDYSVNRLSLLLELNDHNLLGTSAALLATGWLKFSGS